MQTTEFRYLANLVVRGTIALSFLDKVPEEVQQFSRTSEKFKENIDLMVVDFRVQIELAQHRMREIMENLIAAVFIVDSGPYHRECLRLLEGHAWAHISAQIPSQAARKFLYDTNLTINSAGFTPEEKLTIHAANTKIQKELIPYLWNVSARKPKSLPRRLS